MISYTEFGLADERNCSSFRQEESATKENCRHLIRYILSSQDDQHNVENHHNQEGVDIRRYQDLLIPSSGNRQSEDCQSHTCQNTFDLSIEERVECQR